MPKLAIERAVVGRQIDLDFVAALLHSVVMQQSLHEDDVVNRAHVLDRLIVFEISVVVVGVHPNVVDNHVRKFEEHKHHVAINGAGIVVTETTKSLKRKRFKRRVLPRICGLVSLLAIFLAIALPHYAAVLDEVVLLETSNIVCRYFPLKVVVREASDRTDPSHIEL